MGPQVIPLNFLIFGIFISYILYCVQQNNSLISSFWSGEDVVVPPSDLESESSDCIDSDVDGLEPGLENVNGFVLNGNVRNDSPCWDSDDNNLLEIVKNTIVYEKKPQWSKWIKLGPSSTFDEASSWVFVL